MSRYRQTMSEALNQVRMEDADYLKPRLNPQQIANIKKVFSKKKDSDITQSVKDMIKKMDIPTQLAIKQADIPHLSKLVEEDLYEVVMTPSMIRRLKQEFESLRGKKITGARARQLMNILDKLTDRNLELLAKQNIPFVSSGSETKLRMRKMMKNVKVKVTDVAPFMKEDNEFDEDQFNLQIDEGRMSDIDAMRKAGATAAEIAKELKLPVRAVKDILGEEVKDEKEEPKKEEDTEN